MSMPVSNRANSVLAAVRQSTPANEDQHKCPNHLRAGTLTALQHDANRSAILI